MEILKRKSLADQFDGTLGQIDSGRMGTGANKLREIGT
jgi:hypothetical protein